MITLYQLAEQCAQILNANANRLDGFIENTSFDFVIHVNEGEFKRASRTLAPTTVAEANHVTYHINALMKALSSDFDGDYKELKEDGALGDTDLSSMISASMATSIEFLVPFPSITKQVQEGKECITYVFGEVVYNLIAQTLQQGWSANLTDENDVNYLVGTRFTIPSANMKDIRAVAGESLSFTVYGDHFFVNEGVNSNRIKLYISTSTSTYELFNTTRIGIARKTVSDPNLFTATSDKYNTLPVAKNAPIGTQLTITFDAIMRLSSAQDFFTNFALSGIYVSQSYLNVKLELPVTEGEEQKTTQTYTMIPSEIGINGELGTFASMHVSLIEVI